MMLEQVISALASAVLLLLALLIAIATVYIRRRLCTETLAEVEKQLQIKKELAKTAILFVEHAFPQASYETKLATASGWVTKQLQRHGIKVDEKELQELLEAVLEELKNLLSSDWSKEQPQ